MSSMSYISAIERYHEYGSSIRELLASIITGIAKKKLLHDDEELAHVMTHLTTHYPFIDMIFTLTPDGIQNTASIACEEGLINQQDGKGKDRSQRPYYLLAKESENVVITEPYFSSVTGNICISATVRVCASNGELLGYLVMDINLIHSIEYLMGDTERRRFQTAFKAVYCIIVVGLFGVLVTLLYQAFSGLIGSFLIDTTDAHYTPFSIIIYLTLALAIFDLGKTTLEEEVLMHKDIFRHSSTRRTITRFMAAILIAVSIEALLLIFKAALGDGEMLVKAVWMMIAAIGLLVGLGVYVYLGAKAEAILTDSRRLSKGDG